MNDGSTMDRPQLADHVMMSMTCYQTDSKRSEGCLLRWIDARRPRDPVLCRQGRTRCEVSSGNRHCVREMGTLFLASNLCVVYWRTKLQQNNSARGLCILILVFLLVVCYEENSPVVHGSLSVYLRTTKCFLTINDCRPQRFSKKIRNAQSPILQTIIINHNSGYWVYLVFQKKIPHMLLLPL